MESRNTNVIDKPVDANETNRLISSEKSTEPLFTTALVTTSVPSTT